MPTEAFFSVVATSVSTEGPEEGPSTLHGRIPVSPVCVAPACVVVSVFSMLIGCHRCEKLKVAKWAKKQN